jgi:hypothetical protein
MKGTLKKKKGGTMTCNKSNISHFTKKYHFKQRFVNLKNTFFLFFLVNDENPENYEKEF